MMPKAYMTQELPELSIQSVVLFVRDGLAILQGKLVAVTQCMAHINNVDRLDFEVRHSLSDGLLWL